MRAIIDSKVCIGCTLCVQICPEVFRMEVDKAVAYIETVPKGSEDSCYDAMGQCPVSAIQIES